MPNMVCGYGVLREATDASPCNIGPCLEACIYRYLLIELAELHRSLCKRSCGMCEPEVDACLAPAEERKNATKVLQSVHMFH